MQKRGADACRLKLEGKERQKRFGEGDEAVRLFAAALMGHDPSTHQKHYGRWVDEQGLDDAVARWRGQQLPRKNKIA